MKLRNKDKSNKHHHRYFNGYHRVHLNIGDDITVKCAICGEDFTYTYKRGKIRAKCDKCKNKKLPNIGGG